MSVSSLKFGTSGLRGLANELCGSPAYSYSLAFIRALEQMDPSGKLASRDIYIGYDLRPSSPQIAQFCSAAIEDAGYNAVNCGLLPTPALSCYAMQQQAPSIMITGSHIPDDRNGLKFYRPDGEIDKTDEMRISAVHQNILDKMTAREADLPNENPAARQAYHDRYLNFFGKDALKGLKVGVYQHTSVARDLFPDLLRQLGAKVTLLGRAEKFVPVDTEALRDEDINLLRHWASEYEFDAIISTDGDADRPLIADEKGEFIRGDLVGAITSAGLNIPNIVVPVTANSALENCGIFTKIHRTRVGSPYVIEGINKAVKAGEVPVAGFEANGGFLLGSTIERQGRKLSALPTRDAVLPVLISLQQIITENKRLSELAKSFGFRISKSDRLQNIPSENSKVFIENLAHSSEDFFDFWSKVGKLERTDMTDGLRLTLAGGKTIHYRASGNAPELRCYVEATDNEVADFLLKSGLEFAAQQTKGI